MRRIRRVGTGELGGWLQEDSNLSHQGDCWVGDEAKVFKGGRVLQDARLKDKAQLYDGAELFEKTTLSGVTEMYGRPEDRLDSFDYNQLHNFYLHGLFQLFCNHTDCEPNAVNFELFVDRIQELI